MREAVFLAARAAKAAGLCTGGTGNCSMIDRAAGIVAMTPHDSDRVAKTWQEIVLMNLAGEVLDAPLGVEPTSEAAFHLAVYSARPDVAGASATRMRRMQRCLPHLAGKFRLLSPRHCSMADAARLRHMRLRARMRLQKASWKRWENAAWLRCSRATA